MKVKRESLTRVLLGLFFVLALGNQLSARNMNISNELDSTKSVYQLTYLKIHEGKEAEFEKAREEVTTLKSNQKGVAYYELFESFFSFPKKKSKRVFMELIEWESLAALEDASEKFQGLSGMERDKDLFESVSTYRMRPEGNKIIDLNEMIKEGYAVEFAARQIKASKREEYPERRERFMKFIKEQEGFAFDQEFKSIDDDVDILVFGWKSVEDFENAGKKVKRSISQMWKTLSYFMLIEGKDFQVGKPSSKN